MTSLLLVFPDAPGALDAARRSGADALVLDLGDAGALGDRLLTVRTSWVFGPERQGKNFAYQLVRTLAAGKELVCPSDQVSNPSYAPDVARETVQEALAAQTTSCQQWESQQAALQVLGQKH